MLPPLPWIATAALFLGGATAFHVPLVPKISSKVHTFRGSRGHVSMLEGGGKGPGQPFYPFQRTSTRYTEEAATPGVSYSSAIGMVFDAVYDRMIYAGPADVIITLESNVAGS